jgi:ferredoxin
MTRANITKPGILTTHRYWIMALALVLFLPPLSFLFQFTGDSNFCGTWCPRMFFVWRKGASLDAYLMGYLRSFMGVALVSGVLITTFFFGRYWCSHLCPIGGSMEMVSRIIPKFLKINFTKVPAAPLRYGYMAVYFGAAALGIGSLCCSYCHFATIPRLFGAPLSGADMAYFLRTAGLINLGLVLLLGIFAKGGRAYCNLICPIGALDALANRIGARWGKRLVITPAKCNGCGQCLDHCPTWAIDMPQGTARIDALSCMPCGLCETTCQNKAISYKRPDFNLAPKVRTISEKA